MATTDMIYRIILLGHVVAAIVGFGALIAHGAIHAKAIGTDAVTAAPVLRNAIAIARYADYGLYATLAFGMVLVSLSNDLYEYSQPWVIASIAVWLIVVALTHSMVKPGRSGLADLAESISQSAAALGPLEPLQEHELARPLIAKLAIGEAVTQLLLVVSLVLMVWKPGL